MQRIDPQLLAARRHILRRQHGRVGRGLVTVGFDFHAAGDAGDGFPATGITQIVSLSGSPPPLQYRDEPEIGDVDKGVVEGGEDAGDAEDELACCGVSMNLSPPERKTERAREMC